MSNITNVARPLKVEDHNVHNWVMGVKYNGNRSYWSKGHWFNIYKN